MNSVFHDLMQCYQIPETGVSRNIYNLPTEGGSVVGIVVVGNTSVANDRKYCIIEMSQLSYLI